MKKILILIFSFVILTLTYAEINENEMIAQGELSGETILIFKDAETNDPLTDVNVILIKKDDNGKRAQMSLKTNFRGIISFDIAMIEDIVDGKLYIIAEKSGYIKYLDAIEIMIGTVFRNTFAMTKQIPIEKVRFVLSWGEKPRDLDLHLEGKNLSSTDFHISYRDMRNIPNLAKLDRDDINGYGPETLTLDRIEENGKYRLFVHNYSNEQNIKSNAVVHVYVNNKLHKILNLSETDKRNVGVLTIENKDIKYTNTPFE